MLAHFGWKWVSLITSEDDNGRTFVQTISQEMRKTHSCIELIISLPIFINLDPRFIDELAMKLSTLSSTVIVVHGETHNLILLSVVLMIQQISGKVWIITATWDFTSYSAKVKSNLMPFHGALSLAVHTREIPRFYDFLRKIDPHKYTNGFYLKIFWAQVFKCSWPFYTLDNITTDMCTGNEKLEDVDHYLFDMKTSSLSYSLSNAIYAIAHTLHEIYFLHPEKQHIFHPKAIEKARNVHDIQAWQVSLWTRTSI